MFDLTSLTYPLNVYAALLEKDAGSAVHLHYGYFMHHDEPIQQAQNNAVDLLWEQLPSEGKILEVGCGLGGLTHKLVSLGYDVTGITPDPQQCEFAYSRYGNDLPVKCTSLEEFIEDEGTWDILLFHESSQYISMLALFERAAVLLNEEGRVVVLDEFAIKRTEVGREALHNKNYFLAHAARSGFSCVKEINCTQEALPTLNYLDRALNQYRNELVDQIGVELHVLDELAQSNAAYAKKYKDGRFGYFLFDLRRSAVLPRRLGEITPTDQPAVNELFEAVFKQSMSSEMWNWKYGEGRGRAIGLWEDGRLIAHYGGISRCIQVSGTQQMASQSCDVMVASHVRASLKRQGPFFQVCATFLENFVGYGTDHSLAFGFPNDRAYRLPYKLGLYTEPTTNILELNWAARRMVGWCRVLRSCDPCDARDAAIIDGLWQEMSSELQHLAVGVRDSKYLRQRYTNHPTQKYDLYFQLHPITRRPIAVLVVKKVEEKLMLMDWVSRLKNIKHVVIAARDLADTARLGTVSLFTSLPVTSYFSKTQPQENDLKIVVPENAWTASPPISLVKDKLWLTGGDTDFL